MNVKRSISALFILFFLISPILLAKDPVWNIRRIPIDQVTVVAHRGAGTLAPENTMQALRLTWGMGGVPEVDIRTSKDGVLVMFHDKNFKRILPTAPEEIQNKGIEDLSWSEIQKLDIGSFRGKKFVGQKVVSLAEIIDALKKDRKRKVLIDVKRVDFAQLAEETKDVHPQIVLATGNYKQLKQWKNLAPKSEAFYWMGLGKGDEYLAPKIAELEKNNFAYVDRMQIHVNFDRKTGRTTPSEDFLRSVAAKVHARGNIELQFMPWNIPDRPEYYYKLFDLGAGGLGTDRPDIAFESLRNYYKMGEKINRNDAKKTSFIKDPVMIDIVFKFKKGKAKTKKFLLRTENGVQYLKIDPNEIPEKTNVVEIHHPWAEARTGDPGFYVLCSGMYGEFKKRDQDQIHKNTNVVMPLIGVRTPKAAMAIIMTGMRYEAEHWVEYKKDLYRIYPVYKLNEEKAYDPIGIEFHLLKPDASYADIAKVYRKYQLDRKVCVPLKERIKDRPALAYAAGAMEVRIRQGWKPVPSPVGEQTAETEPPMKVAVTFDRFMQIIDEFKKQGIDRAEFCLVGWNIGGHDGRFPQLFPVDPRLGGEEKLKRAIQKARKAGFSVVGHTSETGAYSISALGNRWDRNYLLVRKGGVIKSLRTWSGGNVYHTCPEAVYKRFVPEDYAMLKDLGFYGLHYIDVYSTVNPRTCYSKDHPLTKEGFAEWSNKILAYAQKEIGGVGSEGGFDYCVSNLDYGLYISFYDPGDPVDPTNRVKSHVPKKTLPPLMDRHTPFWQLVYNGIVLNNPFSNTANYTIKNAINRLKLVEYGGRPLFYFYSKFLTTGSSWMGSADLTCDTDEELVHAVKKIKEGYDEFEKIKNLQLEFMEDHQMLEEGLFKTSFADGTDIICNYNANDSVYQGKLVPSLGYIVLKKTEK